MHQSLAVEQEEEYVVQRVVKRRVNKGQVEYKVDWGTKWGRGRYTWEPPEHLENAKDKLDDFIAREAGAGPSTKKGRKRKKRSD